MSNEAFYRIVADVILVGHFLFVAFVVVGFALIVVGHYARWTWVYNNWFRYSHLMAIAIVVLQAWAGRSCPLTVWGERTARTRRRCWLRRIVHPPLAPQSAFLSSTALGFHASVFRVRLACVACLSQGPA